MINLNAPTKLPSKVKWYWLIKTIIIVFLLAWASSLFRIHSVAFWVIFILFGLPISLYLLIYYSTFNFIVDDSKVTINSGIIIKRSKSIPFNQVQNVESVKGILSGLFGISKVSIWTSSPEQIQVNKETTTHRPDGFLHLDAADGKWLKDFILSKHS